MPKISVIGLGNWGTALANHLALKGCQVTGWSIEPEIVEGINRRRNNPRYLSYVTLNSGLRATLSLEEALLNEIIVVVLPAAVLAEVVPRLKVRCETIIVSAVKGIVGDSLLTPLQYIERCGIPCAGLAVLSGPSFARDIVVQRPAGVVAAAKSEEIARRVAELFSSNTLRVYTSTDPLGVELGGIVKNVIAIAAGACDGLELGDSARAGLITRGLAEMMRLAKAMGAETLTLSGLSGLGDLVMTCTCDASRNRSAGLRLGRGEKLPDILKAIGSVVEGVETTPRVLQLARKYKVEMPICEQVARLLSGEASPQEVAKILVSRPMKREFGELEQSGG